MPSQTMNCMNSLAPQMVLISTRYSPLAINPMNSTALAMATKQLWAPTVFYFPSALGSRCINQPTKLIVNEVNAPGEKIAPGKNDGLGQQFLL